MQEAAIAGKPPDNRPICVRPEAWSESAGADLGHASDVRPEQVVNCLRGVRSQWWRVGWWWRLLSLLLLCCKARVEKKLLSR